MPRKFPAALTADIIAEDSVAQAAEGEAARRAAQWVNHVSYWQDYMTIIELEEKPAEGLRPAS